MPNLIETIKKDKNDEEIVETILEILITLCSDKDFDKTLKDDSSSSSSIHIQISEILLKVILF